LAVRFLVGAGNFSHHHRVQTGSGAHTSSYHMSTAGPSLAVKRPGREVDHSPPSSAEVKKAWSYTSIPNTSSQLAAWSSTGITLPLSFTFNIGV